MILCGTINCLDHFYASYSTPDQIVQSEAEAEPYISKHDWYEDMQPAWLRGRTVAVSNAARRAFVATMATYVGLDVKTDVSFVLPAADVMSPAMQLFADGKVDAFLGFPPEPQELRARKIGPYSLDINMEFEARSASWNEW